VAADREVLQKIQANLLGILGSGERAGLRAKIIPQPVGYPCQKLPTLGFEGSAGGPGAGIGRPLEGALQLVEVPGVPGNQNEAGPTGGVGSG